LAELDNPILLDTDVVSLLMRGYLDPVGIGMDAHSWCLSYITVGELAKGVAMARWGLRRWTELADWRGHVVIGGSTRLSGYQC
jgi:toxin FitB